MGNVNHQKNQAAECNSQNNAYAKEKAKATFAGGCFWCMQPVFDNMRGVLATCVGYTGGHTEFPTYEEVSSGQTGHAEAIEIVYDPHQITYRELLDMFWRNIDPTTSNRQFSDYGTQYRTAIFYHTPEQKEIAERTKTELERSGNLGAKQVVTEIVPAGTFYPAEEYHQNYYRKSVFHYNLYKDGSGRVLRLKELWGSAHK